MNVHNNPEVKSDIEIAMESKLLPILENASRLFSSREVRSHPSEPASSWHSQVKS
jgi:hypothetical protein